MLSFICPLPDRQNKECHSDRCGYHLGCVYGLLDARIGDIFYVGSTVQRPSTRYSAHMSAKYRSNFREAWIMAILADGSLPVFLSLFETQTGECEQELREIENAIADDLRSMGHTAICDGVVPVHLPMLVETPYEAREARWRWDLVENTIAEYLDRVNEQARIARLLREIWLNA